MTKFMFSGPNVFIGDDSEMQVADLLPVGTYMVNCHPERGFFLTRVPDFKNPSKMYGNVSVMAKRFLSTFADRRGTTGVLLQGTKGSGKSLTMKETSILGLACDLPTIVVGAAYCGTAFNKFIQAISQPAIMIFDEFEKVYKDEEQEALLTLLDGTFTTKKLIIFTCNNKYKINLHMTNRPGRIFYLLSYTGISQQFVKEYCEDKLYDKDKIESICRVVSLINDFNFDMLQALVEELNRYSESVKDALSILNIEFDYTARTVYNIEVVNLATKQLVSDDLVSERRLYNPLVNDCHLEIYTKEEDEDGDWKVDEDIWIRPGDKSLVASPDLSVLSVKTKKHEIIMKRQESSSFDYKNLF